VIALDASALVAIMRGEPESAAFSDMISRNDCLIGTPTRLETLIQVRRRGTADDLRTFRSIIALKNIVVTDFSASHVEVAETAYERFGKGSGHPAQLNFGDCMAYAVARVANVPLLYKGNDFAHTDIAPAYAP
jgi:ribonuclease VapC